MDGVSAVGDTGASDLAAELVAAKQAPDTAAVEAAVLKKSLDAEKQAMGQILRMLGVGRNLDAQA